MRVIAQIQLSAGNESVGDMWTESKSFDISNKLQDVYDWIKEKNVSNLSKDVKLTIDQATINIS